MKKINNKNYNIYTYSTKKFKTVGAMIVFINNVSLKDLIYSNVLTNVLTYSTKNYQTNREFLIACQNLYDLGLSSRVIKSDNKLVSIFHFTAINYLYTNKNIFKNSVKLLEECLINPNFSCNHFDKKND
ncbi:MAG: hypothetical protein J6X02_03490 [Bacilli bacterium]|nr:hypothetical protein [Bacilli bacterium]